MFNKYPLDKINVTKNAPPFLSRAATHQSFTFNSKFLYELKHIVRLFKTACGKSCNKRFESSIISAWVGARQKLT